MTQFSSSGSALFSLLALLVAPATAALNITRYTNAPLVPHPLPPSNAHAKAAEIVRLFQNTGRNTVWKLVDAVKVEGETFEPEGMVRIGDDRVIVSAGEYIVPTLSYGKDANGSSIIINGTDRANGVGFAHLIVFDAKNGTRIADATLTARGDENYHNGGIDYDGQYIWCTLAQYRPNSTAVLTRVDPATLAPTPLFAIDDHEGGVVHDTRTGTVTLLNWGGRNASTFSLAHHARLPSFTEPLRVVRDPSYFVDYQDCKWLGYVAAYGGRSCMMCSGVATLMSGNTTFNLGGVAIVDVETMTPLAETPITITSALGVAITENPFDVDVVDGKLRLYFMPDQHNSTLYVYEAQPNSPYEY